MAMTAVHSRRVLIVGAPHSGGLELVKDLTGSIPILSETGSTAGLVHEWDVETAYYSARVPIWMDEISDAEAWKSEFVKTEAKEVVEVIGAWVYCFERPEHFERNDTNFKQVEEVLQAIQDVAEEHIGYAADVVMLAVGLPRTKGIVSSKDDASHSELEDLCIEYGFEYIDYGGQGTNEFREKTGFERLKEALESNEWNMEISSGDELDLSQLAISPGEDVDGFTRDEAEMTAELFGMKAALAGNDFGSEGHDFEPPTQQQTQVEDLDKLIGKLLAVKEQSMDLPEPQRKRMAAQAVRDLMNDGEV